VAQLVAEHSLGNRRNRLHRLWVTPQRFSRCRDYTREVLVPVEYQNGGLRIATEQKDVPLPDLCLLGGWKNTQTIVKCYQRPDVGTMRAALASRARLGRGGALERPNRHHESTPRVAS